MNSMVLFVVTLLFGWCGVHKFIQKKYGQGFLYLFTFGIFGIGWFIDCIRAFLSIFQHRQKAPAAPAPSQDDMVEQFCLSLDPEFVSFVLPMIKSGLTYERIRDAYLSAHPDSECEDLMLRIGYVHSYYSNTTTLANLKDCGASKYRIVSMIDNDLCNLCRKYKGRTFPVSSARIGYNCPPFHLGCRCVIVIEE